MLLTQHLPDIAASSYALQLLVYHALAVSAAGVLLLCLGWGRTLFGGLLLVHALLGTALLGYAISTGHSNGVLIEMWRGMSVLCMGVLSFALLWKFKNEAGPRQSLVAVAGVWGVGIVVEDLLVQAQGAPVLRAMHVFFGIFLLLLWLLLTGRTRWVHLPTDYAPDAAAHQRLGTLSSFGLSSQAHTTHTYAFAAVADERKRIAQDIHDGVGSQLVGLIASLDANSPLHRRLHLGLECCLLDLKMAVDNMDSSDANIFDALGSLRYRFTPSLQRAGIRMVWRVDTAGPLLALPQAGVAHVTRIAQECLANVLMHSQAKTVRVICRYELSPDRMLLEVQDDGVGMVQEQDGGWLGKGLPGIRERAHNLGAKLEIDTKKGHGTRVRVQVPVRKQKRWPKPIESYSPPASPLRPPLHQ
jgi:signal transduction histidine kinase